MRFPVPCPCRLVRSRTSDFHSENHRFESGRGYQEVIALSLRDIERASNAYKISVGRRKSRLQGPSYELKTGGDASSLMRWNSSFLTNRLKRGGVSVSWEVDSESVRFGASKDQLTISKVWRSEQWFIQTTWICVVSINYGPVAQLADAFDSRSKLWGFDSLLGYKKTFENSANLIIFSLLN